MNVFAARFLCLTHRRVESRSPRTWLWFALVAIMIADLSLTVVAGDEVKGAVSKLEPAKFADPPAEYRPVDCWWWDSGYLTKERLVWQLEEMHAKGVGGTWLYPRYGANQPRSAEPGFWSDGWWEFVRFALDE